MPKSDYSSKDTHFDKDGHGRLAGARPTFDDAGKN